MVIMTVSRSRHVICTEIMEGERIGNFTGLPVRDTSHPTRNTPILSCGIDKKAKISEQDIPPDTVPPLPATALENLHPLQHSLLHRRAHLFCTLAIFVTPLEELGHPSLLHAVAECVRARQLRQSKVAAENFGWINRISDPALWIIRAANEGTDWAEAKFVLAIPWEGSVLLGGDVNLWLDFVVVQILKIIASDAII